MESAMAEDKIDWTKPIQTEDGRPLELLRAPTAEQRGVVELLDAEPGRTRLQYCGIAGETGWFGQIVNAPTPKLVYECWVNAYPGGGYVSWTTRILADEHAGARIARLHIRQEYMEGDGL